MNQPSDHDPHQWCVSFVEDGTITMQTHMPGSCSVEEAAEWVAAGIFEETSMEESEILRFIVSKSSTQEIFQIDVACQLTVEYDAFRAISPLSTHPTEPSKNPSLALCPPNVRYAN